MVDHVFGGDWTEEKLSALRHYLKAYRLIFTKNAKAQYFKTIYLDAFAGTGSRKAQRTDDDQLALLDASDLDAIETYKAGSARIALGLDQPFDRYIFVDKNPDHAAELSRVIREDFSQLEKRCRVWTADGCEVLRQLCVYNADWNKERAVVFLDPYGMNVEWDLIALIAKTKAIDLWLLWPLGMGVNRLLPKSGKPNTVFSAKLTRMFGCDDWESFYRTETTSDLFSGECSLTVKDVTFEDIGLLYLEQLKKVFAGVAPKVKMLRNSRGNPMYMLCFASANPKGAKTAIDIASYLLDN